MREIPRITVAEAKQRLDRGEAVQFVDARSHDAWAQSNQKLPGAIRSPADEVRNHITELPTDATIIAYCT